MSASTKHRICTALLGCVALVASASAGAAVEGQARNAVASGTFNDANGDGNGAPDLTEVVVSNDAAGAVTIRIAVPNRPQLGSDDLVGLWIDTDRNELTGPFEYRILKFQFGAFLERWDGSAWRIASPPASLVVGWQNGQFQVAFNRADFNIGDAFAFSASGGLLPGDDPAAWLWDDAPDYGLWTYTLVFAPTLGPAKVRPASPKAGGLVSVAVPVVAGGKPVDTGTVKCTATVGRKQLRAVAKSLNAGTAGCTFRLPASTKGKTLRGAVSVTTAGGTATRTFSARVR